MGRGRVGGRRGGRGGGRRGGSREGEEEEGRRNGRSERQGAGDKHMHNNSIHLIPYTSCLHLSCSLSWSGDTSVATATIGLVTGGHGWRGGREQGREGER